MNFLSKKDMYLVPIQELGTLQEKGGEKGTGSRRKAQKAGFCFRKDVSESGEMSAVGGSKRRRKDEMIVHARIVGNNLHFHSLGKLDKVKANANVKKGMYVY